MCIKVVHKYSCGHRLVETANCAYSKGGGCKGTSEKVVTHAEKCDKCGG